jgi:hypothetical protein
MWPCSTRRGASMCPSCIPALVLPPTFGRHDIMPSMKPAARSTASHTCCCMQAAYKAGDLEVCASCTLLLLEACLWPA